METPLYKPLKQEALLSQVMTPDAMQALYQAISLTNTGQKAEAYQQLKALEEKYPHEPNVLLWLTFTSPELEESEKYVRQLATIDPANNGLVTAQRWLDEKRASQQPAGFIKKHFGWKGKTVQA